MCRAAILAPCLIALASCGEVPAEPTSPDDDLVDELEGDGKADGLGSGGAHWTVLVYGSYDTHEAGGLPSSLGDMQQRVTADVKAVNFLYLEDKPGQPNTRLWRVNNRRAELVQDMGERHLGTPATLTEVLKLVGARYPAKRFFLNLVGHTSSAVAAFLPDYTPDPGDWARQRMMYWQVRKAILDSKVKVDVLALCGCGTADLEILARFDDVASYVVGWQTYNTGYADVRWAYSLAHKPTITPRSLAWRVAEGFFAKAHLQQGQPASVGAVETAKLPAAGAAFAALSKTLAARLATAGDELAAARASCHEIRSASFGFFVDAVDFAERLRALASADAELGERAQAFRDALASAIVAGGPARYADQPENARAHGVNLLFMRPGLAGRIVDPSDFDEASAWPASETSFYESSGWRAVVTAVFPRLR